ncbi:hypothetical protein J4401_02835 [Candidatus Woesearchaeota archaeon]|nr:hypothetical protein [Candidatus Woesearchaeota archaeon]
MKMPESADECFYFSRRSLDTNGMAIAWVSKPDCPKCGKAKMGKPIDEKKGSVKIRAKEYKCPSCKFTVPKDEFDSSLTMEIKYKCPHCGKEGETKTEYKRKKFQGVDAYIFSCVDCGKKIPITKKMKDV